jgi:hypothetical protein
VCSFSVTLLSGIADTNARLVEAHHQLQELNENLVISRERRGLTLVPNSAQLELTLPLSAQRMLTLSPIYPRLTRECVSRVLKLSSNVSDVFPKMLKLSSEVSEWKPLASGTRGFCGSGKRKPKPSNVWQSQ